MAKTAVALERALVHRAATGGPGRMAPRILARGEGWAVDDDICTSGPQDRPFEEQHPEFSVAVVAGSFQYQSPLGRELMTPGSIMLVNAGQCDQCGHEHGAGDRCVSFHYSPDYFERLAADAGIRGAGAEFRVGRLPPLREMSALVARAGAGLIGLASVSWEELGIKLATRAVQLVAGVAPEAGGSSLAAEARVTRAIRLIERRLDIGLTLDRLAREARLSPFHFLRTFERLTGVTPHQYVLRSRLSEAAVRLAVEPARVLDVALDCGFGDASTFTRAFRAEFGVSPRRYLLTLSARPAA